MIDYEHLVGRTFVYEETDCYSLLQHFYQDVFEIHLPNYARPAEFWKGGLDLYGTLAKKNGFSSLDVHPSEYRIGDVVLMTIQSPVPNHVGIFVEQGKILHHLWGRLSSVDHYGGIWRNTTVGVFRHKDTPDLSYTQEVDIRDYLSPRLVRRLNGTAL